MWGCTHGWSDGGCTQHLVPLRDGRPLSYGTVLALWRADDAAFRGYFATLLAASPFTTFAWETPGLTQATVEQPFECVLCDAPELSDVADPYPFAERFLDRPEGADIAQFASLGGDTLLLAPLPRAPADSYATLGSFLRRAPARQIDALWQAVGHAMQAQLLHMPVWLSTAGGGVDWLHVRLSSRPKYYRHAPYRQLC